MLKGRAMGPSIKPPPLRINKIYGFQGFFWTTIGSETPFSKKVSAQIPKYAPDFGIYLFSVFKNFNLDYMSLWTYWNGLWTSWIPTFIFVKCKL